MTPFLLPSDVLPHLLRRLKRYKFHGLNDFRPYERLGQHRRGKRVQNALYLPTIKRHSIFEFIVAGKTYKVRDQLVNQHFHACVSTLWTWSIESSVRHSKLSHKSSTMSNSLFLSREHSVHPNLSPDSWEERVRLPTILLRHPPGFGKLRGSVETDA